MVPRVPTRKTWLILMAVAIALPHTSLAAKKLLRVRLDGPILEAPSEDAALAALFGAQPPRTLYNCTREIQKAADDAEIAGIALIIEQPRMSFAQLEEMCDALRDFRKTGKKVYAFMDYASNGSYALAAAADHITLAEYSGLEIVGLHAELSYYRGLLDKLGIEPQMLHCGDYKSAMEPFMRTEPSEPARENINWLLDGIFERWIELIAEGRGLSEEEVRAAVDAAPLHADQALERKLVDAVSSFEDFKRRIHKEFGKDVEVVKSLSKRGGLEIDMNNPFAMFELFGEILAGDQAGERKPGIALIYIEGPIAVGTNQSGPFASAMAGSTTLRAAFIKAAEDDAVKAVVVRVDSPGGSALASDIIWKAARRCASEKPLIVSMGGVAGSGGYYVSLPGDVIFADASTITASIGVVGGKLVWNGLFADKLGITTTEFDRGAHAGLSSMNRPWNEEELAWITDYLNRVYAQFKGRVMESRGDRIKGDLEEHAGGRVFTGRQALERGLIDRIGGLSDAIALAAQKAGLDDYEVYVLPEQKEPIDILREMFSGEPSKDEFEISGSAAVASNPLVSATLPLLQKLAPQQSGNLRRALTTLMILDRERVGCFMPFDLAIR
ncbi:MAG: signal peptide peptidase SppA [Planctomycetota bacterium]|nr:MAG: signal peptide peptidase SppA [Planctomycetota bacterium]